MNTFTPLRADAIKGAYLFPDMAANVSAKLAFEPDDQAAYRKTREEALGAVFDALPTPITGEDFLRAMINAEGALAESYLKHGLTQDMKAAALRTIAPRVLSALEGELLEQLKIAVQWIKDKIRLMGPCDHRAGRCICADKRMLATIRAAIFKAEGISTTTAQEA